MKKDKDSMCTHSLSLSHAHTHITRKISYPKMKWFL